MSENKHSSKRVAYIAPEIPGASSTFVYNEIFSLEDFGCDVYPFSIHKGIKDTTDERLNRLSHRAVRVYDRGLINIAFDNIRYLILNPLMYLQTMLYCLLKCVSYLSRPKICFGLVYRFFVSASVAQKLKDLDISHIHAHFMHFPADIALFSSMMSGVPFSVTAHANDIFCNSWLLKDKGNKAKFISTISNYNIEYLCKKGIAAEKLHLVRCGVDTGVYEMRGGHPQNDVPVFGFLGRMVEKKGVDILLQACSELLREGKDFKVELVGDGPLKASMQALSDQLGLNGHVNFIGAMENRVVFDWLQKLDAFVLPCKKDSDGDMDGIPVALMEAMLLGTPVISTRISGLPELVENDITGLSADANNVKQFAECMLKVINKSVNIESLSLAARHKVVDHFNLHDNSKALFRLFSLQQ